MWVLVLIFACCLAGWGQQEASDASENDLDHTAKLADDVLWHLTLGDIATVRTFRYPSAPRTATGKNPMIVYGYAYLPKNLNRSRKYPLVMMIHGGVHSNHMTGGPANAATIVRELLEQGYVVAAADYRGSTGYGEAYKKAIDYGGRENEDVHLARAWMLENYSFLDPERVGVMAWSHGAMIGLMNLFAHPADYACVYAGVPVSDLTERRKYLKSMPNTIAESAGEAAAKDEEEYKRRSPVTYAAKLAKPLLIHANTSDETVRIVEVKSLLEALTAAGRPFEHKIYEAAPGGHHFNRIDSALARKSRSEVYEFLRRYLKP